MVPTGRRAINTAIHRAQSPLILASLGRSCLCQRFFEKKRHKVLHLDVVQSFECGTHNLVGIGNGFLGTVSFCISFSIGQPDNILCLLAFPISVSMSSSFLGDILRDCKKIHFVFNEFSMDRCFFVQEMPACAIDDAYVPIW